jgi:VWFA-related protein
MGPGWTLYETIRGFGIASNRFDARYELEGCVLSRSRHSHPINLGKFGPMTTNCPRKTLLFIIAQIFLLLGGPAFAQDPPLPNTPAPKQGETPPKQAQPPAAKDTARDKGQTVIHITTRTVVVPVTVKDRHGNLVPDLQKDEFRIFEDGVEQNITGFRSDPVPLSIVVLISNDLKQKDADQVEPSLRAIVGGMSTSDEAYISRFDQYFHEGTGFIKDQDKLIAQLKRTQISADSSAPPSGDPFHGPVLNGGAIPVAGGPPATDPSVRAIKGQSTTALDDAVYGAATVLQSRPSRDRRKVILLISDGQNGPHVNTHSYDEVRAELLKQEIAVYSVATGSAYFDRKFNRLVSYAHDTGGDVYFGAKQNSFSEFYAQICEEARNQYTLYFEPRGDSKVDYHPIEVRVRREGLTILAREGYYGGTFAAVPQK